MTYHAYYIDKSGEPFIKVQMSDEKEAVDMLLRYADHGGRRMLAEVARFDVGEDNTVIIFRDVI